MYGIFKYFKGKVGSIVTTYEDKEHADKICKGMNESAVPLVFYKVKEIVENGKKL